ncbi:MAG: hypothetical protein AABX53_04325 [Nanoarchaeota archaeon]
MLLLCISRVPYHRKVIVTRYLLNDGVLFEGPCGVVNGTKLKGG